MYAIHALSATLILQGKHQQVFTAQPHKLKIGAYMEKVLEYLHPCTSTSAKHHCSSGGFVDVLSETN